MWSELVMVADALAYPGIERSRACRLDVAIVIPAWAGEGPFKQIQIKGGQLCIEYVTARTRGKGKTWPFSIYMEGVWT